MGHDVRKRLTGLLGRSSKVLWNLSAIKQARSLPWLVVHLFRSLAVGTRVLTKKRKTDIGSLGYHPHGDHGKEKSPNDSCDHGPCGNRRPPTRFQMLIDVACSPSDLLYVLFRKESHFIQFLCLRLERLIHSYRRCLELRGHVRYFFFELGALIGLDLLDRLFWLRWW